jgi:periplasmic protein TonB
MTSFVHLLEPKRTRISRWAGAAAIVMAAHLCGAALAFVHWQEDDTADDVAGAIAVELAPLPAATPVDSPDVAHGPLMEEAVLTPQASKQTVQEVTKEIPVVEQSPVPNPEVALPMPRPDVEKKPDEQDQEEIPNKQNPEQASAAPLTTAPPKVEAQPAPAAANPVPSTSTSLARVQASWERRLINHLNRYKRYPEAARSHATQGVVVVAFSIDHGGHLIASHVARSSGSPALDEEGLAMLKRASPLPAPPDQISRPTLELTLPIQFRIR